MLFQVFLVNIIKIAIFVICISIFFPPSQSKLDEQYEECKRVYQCGNIRNLGYPFWGNGRPHFCGHEGFELECKDDVYSVIHMNHMEFRVLSTIPSAHTMTIARMDLWNSLCIEKASNTTLNHAFFDYSLSDQNLTLSYNCSFRHSSYYSLDEICPNTGGLVIGSMDCERSIYIEVPVLRSAVEEYQSSKVNGQKLHDVINKGFDVQYYINDGACSKCADSGGLCGSSNSTLSRQFICLCPYGPDAYFCQIQGSKINVKTIAIVTGAVAFAGTTILLACVALMICSKHESMLFWKVRSSGDQNVEAFVRNYGSLAPKRYSYSDVKKMTKSFRNKLGQGGYGSVYRGKLPDGRPVAVKVLNNNKSKGNGEEFINEVASISRTSHVNIVSLLGFCFEGAKKALIYEFMPNGSLEKFIYNENSLVPPRHLGWDRLHQIATGIAKGLEYLHCGCNTRILHFDVKPHNILLDKNFRPKISDFGLAKLCLRKESIVSMLEARGTIGYVAPEVFNRNFGGVSHKSDVYSYGMMLLEMVGGRKNINAVTDHSSKIYFPHWIYKRLQLDEGLGFQGVMSMEENEVVRKMILVGLWCIQTDPSHRPSMSKVIEMLEGSLEALKIPPKPFLSSPPRSPKGSSSDLDASQSTDI